MHGADETARGRERRARRCSGRGLSDLDAATPGGSAARRHRTSRCRPAPLPPIVDLLAADRLGGQQVGRATSDQEGGAYLNNERITDVDRRACGGRSVHGRWLVLRRGKAQPSRPWKSSESDRFDSRVTGRSPSRSASLYSWSRRLGCTPLSRRDGNVRPTPRETCRGSPDLERS